jgi:O-antigen/teichoic acid export membrane protein
VRLFRGFLLTSASQVANLAAAVVTRVVMARLMGPAGYGGFGVGLNLVTVTSKVLAFGSAPAVQYNASKGQESRGDCLRTVLGLGMVLGTAVAAFSVLVLPGFLGDYFNQQPVAASVYPFLALGVLPIVLGGVLASLLIPWGRIFAYAVIQLVPGAFTLVFFGVSLAVMTPLAAAVAGYLVAWGTGLGYNLWVLRGEMRGGRFQWSLATRIVRYGLVVWPNVVLAIGAARTAVVLGAGYVAGADIGLLVVALNLVEGVLAFHAPMGQLLFTRVSERERQSFAITQESMRVSVFVMVVVSAAFVAAGRPILLVLFGGQFAGAWHLALILIGTGVCHSLMRVLNNFLAGMGLPSRNTITLAVETALLLVLVPVLAHSGSVVGLAVASVCSAFVGLLVATVQTCRIMRCSPTALYATRRADLLKLHRRVRRLLGDPTPPTGGGSENGGSDA